MKAIEQTRSPGRASSPQPASPQRAPPPAGVAFSTVGNLAIQRAVAGEGVAPWSAVLTPWSRAGVGNQGVGLLVQRACGCGGTCATCAAEEEELPLIQRTCACGGICSSCRGEAAEELAVQRASPESAGATSASNGIVRRLTQRPGAPLDVSARRFMEPRFGTDFSAVRVHTDGMAADAARRLDAKAFTVGQHVFFARDHYAPGTAEGRRLLAHELTHTIQQRGRSRFSQKKVVVGRPGDAYEREADRVAALIVERQPSASPTALFEPPFAVARVGHGDQVIQRQPAAAVGERASGAPEASGTLDTLFAAVRGAALLVPGLAPLAAAYELIRGVVYLWNHRQELFDRLLTAIGTAIETVPALAMQKLQEFLARFGPAVVEAGFCILNQLGTFFVSLAEHWRDVLVSFLRDIFFVGLYERSIPVIIENLGGLIDDLSSGEYRSAIDRGVAIMTEVNAIAGVFFLWYALITTVIGAIAGSPLPAAGNAAGAAAGLTFAEVLGLVLIASVVATEMARVGRGIDEMIRNWDDVPLREAACRQVAEGVFALALTAALFYLGPAIQRIARSIIQRAVAFVQGTVRALSREAAAALESLAARPVVTPQGVVMPFVGPTPEPVVTPRPAVRGPQPRPTVRPQPVVEPTPTPQAQPAVGPRPRLGAAAGLAPLTEDPLRRADRCRDLFGLMPSNNARWQSQRGPINGEITVDAAAFRLDRGRPAPAGQPTTTGSRAWVRAIGHPADDAGHVIARRFGGTATFNGPDGNIFPQNLSINRGAMVVRDREAADLHAVGCDVCVHIQLGYASSSDLRPTQLVHTIIARRPGTVDFVQPTPPQLLPNP